MIRGLRYAAGTHAQALRELVALRLGVRGRPSPARAFDVASRVQIGEMSIRPEQKKGEVVALLELVASDRPSRVLEIGTLNGGTLFLLACAASRDARLLSLDLRQYNHAHRFLFRHFGCRSQKIHVQRIDSHAEETRRWVEEWFDRQPLDLLFIDGDHSYEGVRRDWELYSPLVRPGGLIALHDIVEGPEWAVGEVPRFWREVRDTLDDVVELVESRDQGGYGIGVGRRASRS